MGMANRNREGPPGTQSEGLMERFGGNREHRERAHSRSERNVRRRPCDPPFSLEQVDTGKNNQHQLTGAHAAFD